MSRQRFDTADLLRLEVEDDPTGLVNLARNPSGDLGGWAWLTPLGSSSIAGDPTTGHLTYTRTSAGTSYFTSEPVACTAGDYIAASYETAGGSAYHRVRFEFYDTTGALVSSSAQTALTAPGAGPVNVNAVQAPATTASARLRFDLYTSGGANPAGTHTAAWRKTAISTAADAADLGTVRVNLIPNPSAETDTTGWSRYAPTNPPTLGRTSAQHAAGAYAFTLTAPGGGPNPGTAELRSPNLTITPGLAYTFQAQIRSTTARAAQLRLEWSDAMGNSYGTLTSGATTTSTSAWTTLTVTGDAPAGADRLRCVVLITAMTASGEVHYIDACHTEATDTPGSYFDGSTAAAGGWTYSWTGTAHASASRALASNLPYADPVPYADVLSSTVGAIRVVREGFALGSLAATIRNTNLDPAVSDLIRPGRRVRLLYHDGTTWQPLFTGKISPDTATTYDLGDPGIPDLKRTRIELVAVDDYATLAATTRKNGYATVAELPAVLEGVGVPWSANGSGNQVATTNASIRSVDDEGTALGQVITTRDTVAGYAWIDRRGIVTVWDLASIDQTPHPDPYDEDVYSDISTGHDAQRCVNEVTVIRLEKPFGGGLTTEVTYGPYRDEESINTWGVHSLEVRINSAGGLGATEAADVAHRILDANATPAVRANELTLPAHQTPTDVATYAGLDLYDLITVQNADTGIDDDMRITRLEHTIEIDKWTTTLGLEINNSEPLRSTPFLITRSSKTALAKSTSGVANTDILVPIGVFLPYGGTTPPAGWLACDGSAVSRTDYAALFAVIGTSYGAGNGTTTFNLPDTRRRFILGKGGSMNNGDNDGVATVNNRDPAHTHTIPAATVATDYKTPNTGTNSVLRQTSFDGHNHGGATGGATTPHLVATYIIRAA